MPRRVSPKPSILFCGNHRVNYAMFDPVYQKLRKRDDVWLGISTGRYRRRMGFYWIEPKDPTMRNELTYSEFDIAPEHIVKTSVQDSRVYDVFVTSNRSLRIQPPNSRMAIQIFHGVSFRNFAVNPQYKRFDKLFFAGPYHASQYVERGILPEGDSRIELIGMPKLDRLVDGTIKREDVLRQFDLDPALPTILWAPTGANDNSIDVLGEAGLKAAQAGEWNLIVKLHDHPHLKDGRTEEGVMNEVKATFGPRARLATHSDVAPLLVAADLLISDASSVAYEYTLRDRPIIFVDVPKLLDYRASLPECNMDMDTIGRKVGRIVKTADELKTAISEEFAEPGRLSDERKSAAEKLFYKPGTASQRMADRLIELALLNR